MKKALYYIALVCAVFFLSFTLVACNGNGAENDRNGNGSAVVPDGGGSGGGSTETPGGEVGGSEDKPDSEIGSGGSENKPDGDGGSGGGSGEVTESEFQEILFEDAEFDYDGHPKSLAVSGNLPEGTEIAYEGNGKTDAGVYPVTATLTKVGYRTRTLNATLTIRKIDFAGVTFLPKTAEYDAAAHSVEITGILPEGCGVVYSGGSGIANNEAVEVGVYALTATVSGKNYNTLILETYLTIISREEVLFTHRDGSTVYFQNPLDGDKLYNAQNGAVAKSSNDKPQYFTSAGGEVYFLSKTLFASGIAVFANGKSEILYEVSDAKYLVSDGTNLYYSVDSAVSALKKTTGIYKIPISELKDETAEPAATRLSNAKAEYLQAYGGYVYFSNLGDKKKLHRINVNSNNGVSELVYDYKVSDIVISGSKLFFMRGMSTDKISEGAAIYSYDLETKTDRRIVYSKGKYLLPLNNDIYFVNTDMLSATIFGDGIYKAPQDGSGWASETFELLTGASKVVGAEGNDAIYSLTTDGTNLYYYRTKDKHLYRYNPNTDTETDLMANFTPKEETPIIATPYGELKEYRGYLWYTNLSDGGKLYRYDPASGNKVRATSSTVADFAFDGDYLYYAGFRLTNCDIYRSNLVTGETERISTDKGLHFAFTDNKVYYMNCKGKNTLNEMDKDGANDRVVFDTETLSDYDITVKDGNVYFVAKYFYRYDPNEGTAVKLSETSKPNEYLIFGDTVYFLNDLATNSVSALPLSGGDVSEIQSLGATGSARSFFVYGGEIHYFARKTVLTNIKTALYRISGGVSEEISIPSLENYSMNSAIVSSGKIYFLDVWFLGDTVPNGTGKLMILDMDTQTVRAA